MEHFMGVHNPRIRVLDEPEHQPGVCCRIHRWFRKTHRNPPPSFEGVVERATDDSQVGKRCTADYAECLEKWAPWNRFIGIRDENQFVYRR
eukprot:CAMPEP_0185780080 /NCGR_PEP_ID=MMETSP1174-20130828/97936_1 /TAXON_ID=35687 /ORGANISM="Dictyocha speculum, Strain CCMP1381" /LENGTH=90 /DNA_ID=CAMNT_0028469483 /DNA_START=390 /DNA_END=658 /DNA_ORIENTATION=-